MTLDWLDFATTLLGLLYIWLEYRAHIALWIVGVIMPALDIYLYYSHGLYGDAGMAAYYTAAGIYGFAVWKWREGNGHNRPAYRIAHMPLRLYLPATAAFFAAWGITYYILIRWTNSTVPVLDSFTNALSFVALWTLSRKYIEQWLLWIVVDAVCAFLYVQKGIPFKAGLYALYIAIAVAGWLKWQRMYNNR